jgi:hypothetical protein
VNLLKIKDVGWSTVASQELFDEGKVSASLKSNPSSVLSVSKSTESTPRYSDLARLSVLSLQVHLQSVELSLVKDKVNDAAVSQRFLLARTLERYCCALLPDLQDPVMNVVHRDLALKRFHNSALPYGSAMEILTLTQKTLIQQTNAQSPLALADIGQFVESILNESEVVKVLDQQQEFPKILFKIEIMRAAVHVNSLTYDYCLLFTIDTLSIFDCDRVSLLHLHNGRLWGEINDDENTVFDQSLLDISVPSSGLTVKVVKKDRRFPFGIGGSSLSSIVANSTTDAVANAAFCESMSVCVRSRAMAIEFDGGAIEKLLDGIGDIQQRVVNRDSSSKTSEIFSPVPVLSLPKDSESQTPSPSMHLFASVSVDSLNSIVSYKSHTFCGLELSFLKSTVEVHDNCCTVDALVDALEVLDLTEMGRLRRHVIWKSMKYDNVSSTDMLSCSALFNGNENSVLMSLHHLRANVVLRFLVEEMIEFIKHCIIKPITSTKWIESVEDTILAYQELIVSDDDDSDFDERDLYHSTSQAPRTAVETAQTKSNNSKFSFRLLATDNELHVPRHSLSNDTMCVVANEIEVTIGKVDRLFDAPSDDVINSSGTGHLYFDSYYNRWRRSSDQVNSSSALPCCNEHAGFGVDALDEIDVYFECREDSCLTPREEDRGGLRIDILASNIDVFTSIEPLLRGRKLPCNVFSPAIPMSATTLAVNALTDLQRVCPLHNDVRHGDFVHIASPEWNHLSVDNQHPECLVQPQQRWIKNTRESFNLHVIVDVGEGDLIKLLFADTAQLTRLNVAASHCEYHCFLALWFENVCEQAQFLQFDLPSTSKRFPFSEQEVRHFSELLEVYGSKAYVEHLLGRPCDMEMLVIRAEVVAAWAIETEQHVRDIPLVYFTSTLVSYERENVFDYQFGHSSTPITSVLQTNSNNHGIVKRTQSQAYIGSVLDSSNNTTNPLGRKVIPFLDLRISSLIVSVRNFEDIIRVFVSGENIDAYDISTAKDIQQKPAIPLLLRCSHRVTTESNIEYNPLWPRLNNYCYGYPEFTYGFNQLVPVEQSLSNVPFKMSLVSSSASDWMTINIGIDMIDVNAAKVNVILLASDLFSVYFRFEEYGHPGIAAYNTFPKALFDHGGLDLRLFITQPHVVLLYSNDRVTTPALLLEALGGISFRYIFDTMGSTRYEVSVHELAVILVKHYRPPNLYRGVRGSSGSGRGVRTTIEHLNLEFFHHYDIVSQETDIKVDVYGAKRHRRSPTSTSNDSNSNTNNVTRGHNNEIVDIFTEWNGSHVLQILEPTCLRPVRRSTYTSKLTGTIDIVTCYEDILFCLHVVCAFFSVDTVALFSSSASADIEVKSSAAQEEINSTTPQQPVVFVFGLFCIRFMLVDNVLGMHLPLIQV